MKRLITETDQAFERMLLRSARLDVAPENGAREAMEALAAAATRLPTVDVGPPPLDAGQLIAKRLGTLGAWKWLGAGVVLGGFAGAGAMAIHRSPPSPSIAATLAVDAPRGAPVVRAPAESFPEPSPAPPAAAISSPAAIPPSAPRFRAPAVPATSTSNVAEAPSQAVTEGLSTLKAEAAAIDRARRALASGSPGQAIELLDRYERESPTHVLAPDAWALRIQAEKARGNDVVAKRLAEKFLSQYPSDPHAERVRRVLLGQ
ncbi:MAG TPA: hypothetical protein VK550_03740 [Polyangiaceae bacterium]|nr:hypothetical protein [Polyangiaceae bacterium]